MAVALKPVSYLALLHYPVLNKHRQIVTTAVANMDIHDIARAARTYDVGRYYIVTPVAAQRTLIQTVLDHWRQGYGAEYNGFRREAFSRVFVRETFEQVCLDIREQAGIPPLVVVTGAALDRNLISCEELRKLIAGAGRPCLLVFGTGWGLADSIISRADRCLAPVQGATDYNHLSVRSAVAVVLDRLFGR
ncbi:MAG TPA: RNA methyltransferase [Syntrophales bacterium]|nr:RNA methyltransferase [Syntrophales bacterium]HON22821.1 RNA methyltransferase [Syntrophales bacterium]HPC31591.1 RNA methyltransferase [Syntrophales bacterium]HRR46204.1 RNA methyltransferase [Syntrophales bacterium]HRU87728.1 RNA methyltransferase [Syntrophales bacterium]